MKKIWARVSMSLHVTDDEWQEIFNNQGASDELMQRLADEGRIKTDGEAYTPEGLYDDNIDFELNHGNQWVIPLSKNNK